MALARGVLIFLTLICFTGCSTMRPVPVANPKSAGIQIGDHVRVERKSGPIQEFTVTKVDEQAIYGEVGNLIERVPYADMRTLHREEISTGKTTGAVFSGLGALWVVFIGVVLYGLTQLDDALKEN